MKAPDGAATMRDEQQHVRAAANDPEPTHDVVALDEEGSKLYTAESCFSEREAEKAMYRCNDYLEEAVINRVDQFEVRER